MNSNKAVIIRRLIFYNIMTAFAKAAKRFDPNRLNSILNSVFSTPNIQNWIVKTIQNRLFEKGETGTGVILKTDSSIGDPYSPVTMDIKSFQGQRIRNVTLKDSGEFYKSFRIILNLFGFEIDAQFEKDNGNIYKNFTNQFSSKKDFENQVMSLSDAEIRIMINTMILPEIRKRFL